MQQINRRQLLIGAAAAAVASSQTRWMGLALGATEPVDAGAFDDYKAAGVFDAFTKGDKLPKADKFFLIHDGERLFAASALCTHRSCVLLTGADGLDCKCHHSIFTLQGTPTAGPAKKPLERMSIQLDDKKHVMVDPSRRFALDQWDDPKSFIPTKA